ncbi:MAG: hypothetical protein V5A39_02085 [Haloarculaceae archaeon]
MQPTRRRVLGAAGLLLGGGLAGCGGDDPPPGLYATDTQVVYRPEDDRFDYPEDVGVRVTVENTSPNRQDATLRTTLEYVTSGGTPAVVDSWTREWDISMSRGSSRAYFVVFEGVGGVATGRNGTFRSHAEVETG